MILNDGEMLGIGNPEEMINHIPENLRHSLQERKNEEAENENEKPKKRFKLK